MLDLELSALQADGYGEVISTPKVLTADKQKQPLPPVRKFHISLQKVVVLMQCRLHHLLMQL